MKKEKKLYRIDINLKYLVYTDTEYGQADVLDWIKNEIHSGELDDSCEISEVKDSEEVEDFTNLEIEYRPYYTDDEVDGILLSDVIEELGLDTKKLIKRLESLGYKVTKK